jgi:hypothetical protein
MFHAALYTKSLGIKYTAFLQKKFESKLEKFYYKICLPNFRQENTLNRADVG